MTNSLEGQLISDFHAVFIQFQEDLCNRQSDDPFQLAIVPEQVLLQTSIRYRDVLYSHIKSNRNGDVDDIKELHALIHLIELFIFKKDKLWTNLNELLEAWINESFPIKIHGSNDDESEFWKSLYQLCLRRKFDQVCALLHDYHGIYDCINQSHVDVITELILAYPNAQQRLVNPYALESWRLDVESRLKVEDFANWNPKLKDLVACLQGNEVPQSVKSILDNWQDLFVSYFNKPVDLATVVSTLISERPSQNKVLDQIYLSLFLNEVPTLQLLSQVNIIGPHFLNLLSFVPTLSLAQHASSAMLAYGETLMTSNFWNLATDYLWCSSDEGRKLLESSLFQLASSGSYSRQLSIIDVCHNFQLNLLADAIHVMISKREYEAKNLSKALHHAILAQQDFLLNRICDESLRDFYSTKQLTSLEILGPNLIDLNPYPRLKLLNQIYQMESKVLHGDFISALVLLEEILACGLIFIPEFIRPHLLSFFIKLNISHANLKKQSLTALFTVLNDHSALLSPDEISKARFLLNRFLSLTILSK